LHEEDLQKAKECKTTTFKIPALLLNLPRCNSIVAYKVASVFYGRNRFPFSGDWTWERVLGRWKKIGLKIVALFRCWKYVYAGSHKYMRDRTVSVLTSLSL
jgi:hypothetical protein